MAENPYPRYGMSDAQLASLGSVCVAWSALDAQSAMLATYLFTAPYTFETHIIAGTVGFRERLGLIRATARRKLNNDEAFGDLDTFLTLIDEGLRPERNRVIHDLWLSGGNHRVQLTPRFSKRPHKTRMMETFHKTEVKLDDVGSLAHRIVESGTAIGRAAINYVKDPAHGPDTWPGIFSEPIQSLSQRYR